MNLVSFYHKDTGLFKASRFSTSDPALIPLNTPANYIAIEGHFDHLSQRVNLATGAVEDYQPPQPDANHEWNKIAKRWQLNAATARAKEQMAEALQAIANLEASQPRAVREILLGRQAALLRLREIDEEIAELRKKLL